MTSLSPSTVKDFIFNLAQTHYARGLPAVAMMNTYDLKYVLKMLEQIWKSYHCNRLALEHEKRHLFILYLVNRRVGGEDFGPPSGFCGFNVFF